MTAKETAIRKRVPVISLNVDLCDYDAVMAKVVDMASAGNGGYVCVSTVHMAMEGHDDSEFARLVNAADLVIPDGMPMAWMQRRLGNPEASQVRGPSLMPMLMKYAAENGLKVGFYGGRPEVIDKIRSQGPADFPGLQISYAFSPPFRPLTDAERAEIVEKIIAAGTQILFVGLGCPKQERWMAAHRDQIKAVMLGVGAAFDLYTGTLAEAPDWVRRSGFEWLYRLSREPRRLWRRYFYTNSRFIIQAGLQLSGLRRSGTKK